MSMFPGFPGGSLWSTGEAIQHGSFGWLEWLEWLESDLQQEATGCEVYDPRWVNNRLVWSKIPT